MTDREVYEIKIKLCGPFCVFNCWVKLLFCCRVLQAWRRFHPDKIRIQWGTFIPHLSSVCCSYIDFRVFHQVHSWFFSATCDDRSSLLRLTARSIRTGFRLGSDISWPWQRVGTNSGRCLPNLLQLGASRRRDPEYLDTLEMGFEKSHSQAGNPSQRRQGRCLTALLRPHSSSASFLAMDRETTTACPRAQDER